VEVLPPLQKLPSIAPVHRHLFIQKAETQNIKFGKRYLSWWHHTSYIYFPSTIL
jgi:hypothetical protein